MDALEHFLWLTAGVTGRKACTCALPGGGETVVIRPLLLGWNQTNSTTKEGGSPSAKEDGDWLKVDIPSGYDEMHVIWSPLG